jgi:uncharacterized protein Yka (UPF0111/DUF47 family)
MAKVKNDYFKMIEQQVSYCVEASEMLEAILSNYSAGSIAGQQEKMHSIEQKADELHHEILTKLSVEFITPIDQEDILHLVQIIDDITDELDEVVLEFYMYNIETMPDYAVDISRIVSRCVKDLYEAAAELKNFKKPDKLRKLLVSVNTTEGQADALYVEAIHKLFASSVDAKTLIGTKMVYESLENCCDLCEHAADVIEQIIIKNT